MPKDSIPLNTSLCILIHLCSPVGTMEQGNDSPCLSSEKCLFGRPTLGHLVLVKKSDPIVLSRRLSRSCSVTHLSS